MLSVMGLSGSVVQITIYTSCRPRTSAGYVSRTKRSSHHHVIRLPWSAVRSVTLNSWRQAVLDKLVPVPSSTAFILAYSIMKYVKKEVYTYGVVRSGTIET